MGTRETTLGWIRENGRVDEKFDVVEFDGMSFDFGSFIEVLATGQLLFVRMYGERVLDEVSLDYDSDDTKVVLK